MQVGCFPLPQDGRSRFSEPPAPWGLRPPAPGVLGRHSRGSNLSDDLFVERNFYTATTLDPTNGICAPPQRQTEGCVHAPTQHSRRVAFALTPIRTEHKRADFLSHTPHGSSSGYCRAKTSATLFAVSKVPEVLILPPREAARHRVPPRPSPDPRLPLPFTSTATGSCSRLTTRL